MNALIKVSDIVAGTGAMLIALLYIAPDPTWMGTRYILIATALVGLYSGWHVARERHWIMKIFLYAGMMVLCILLVDLTIQTSLKVFGS